MDSEITGIMVYYYFVCKRKLWYFCHGIQMEADNENVQLGKLLDASSYSRDSKHVLIDNMINIDFIRDKNEVHEVKKSKAIEDAGIWQLKYYLYYLKNKGVNDVTGSIDYPLLKKKIHVELSEEDIRNHLDRAKSIEELMGMEGNIRKRYYAAWNAIINQNINFEKRVMHPPDNMINSLISFVNSLVYTRILSEIYHTQLNPTISYLHEPGVRRFSLCLDLSEIFKPLIGDRLIFSLLNKNQITEDSFTEELNFLHLKKSASQLIASEFENRMKQTIMHKEIGRQVSYQYLMRLECYKLIKHLLGEKEYEGFRIWW